MAYLYSQPRAFNYTKIYNPVDMAIAFPNALGLPSVYTLNVPTIVKFGGEVRLQSHPNLARGSDDVVQVPQYLNVTAEVDLV